MLDIRDDFLQTLNQCQQITLEDYSSIPWYKKLGYSLLKLFAPLM